MECNKDDAISAKNIAEKKMGNKDYKGARDFVIQSHNLYPDLDNLQQMVMVCNVHCSAEEKFGENERNWYKILNCDENDDEAFIKRQYRKLALMLHPDKNRFPGAGDAFQLISEAHSILVDFEKRRSLDIKLMSFVNIDSDSEGWVDFALPKFSNKQQIDHNRHNGGCTSGFVEAFKMASSERVDGGVADQMAGNSSRLDDVEIDCDLGGSKHDRSPAKKVESVEKTRDTFAKDVELDTDHASRRPKRGRPSKHGKSPAKNVEPTEKMTDGFAKDDEVETDHALRRPKRGRPSKRGKSPAKKVESTEKMTDGFAKDEEVEIANAFRRPKRGRPEKKFNAKEKKTSNVADNRKGTEKEKEKLDPRMDDSVKMSKKVAAYKKEKVSASTEDNGISPETCNNLANSSFGIKQGTRVIEYPEPEFNDFDKERAKNRFSAGQIWAVYDTLDAMPRFYALINNVVSENFKLLITWLEPESDNEEEIKWIYEGLPTSCGKFRPGSSEVIEDHSIFSHIVSWKRRVMKGCAYEIYPRIGEIWALFKNWDIKWYRDLKSRKDLEFDLVKILSDYDDNVGVHVGFLRKVNGFTSLFAQLDEEMNRKLISVRDIFRFSHRVPSFQMTGTEGPNVPQMSFELDSASLPAKVPNEKEAFQIPQSEFFNFDAEKSVAKVQIGQFWAIYSHVDTLPKYYGQVKKINTFPNFTLQVNRLLPSKQPKSIIEWLDSDMLVTCGIFKLDKEKAHEVDGTAISHQVRIKIKGKNADIYVVYPQKGEVWAVYKNWTAQMKCADLVDCEYEVVEILEATSKGISVLGLESLVGYKSVFRPRLDGKFIVPKCELNKFSHQIPGFRLMGQQGDMLRGHWELDSAAVPLNA